MSCIATTDCAEISTGCCFADTVESVAEDSVWGDMPVMEVGVQAGMCASAEW